MKSSKVREKDRQFELCRFTPLSIKILEFIGTGKTATEVVNLLGCSKSTVSYHVNRFEKQDFLRLNFQDVINSTN